MGRGTTGLLVATSLEDCNELLLLPQPPTPPPPAAAPPWSGLAVLAALLLLLPSPPPPPPCPPTAELLLVRLRAEASAELVFHVRVILCRRAMRPMSSFRPLPWCAASLRCSLAAASSSGSVLAAATRWLTADVALPDPGCSLQAAEGQEGTNTPHHMQTTHKVTQQPARAHQQRVQHGACLCACLTSA